MKATKTNTTAISKLVARFDDELMEILLEDLRNFRARNQFRKNNQQVAAQQTLKAA
ncbi:hypothetical protein [Mucilaginibacter dorajii]|uniref:Uncharacterized protein n=1 Tax=Mucilaginibacter dorajii TaxID=692994 RepID=A0ABP7QXN0_9SPHI|nr:hypothetical protein [Mucilaginibacter dorajii]MCS3735682.1 hypothetical protein [Mucilaginibacter dorajii]